MLESEELFSIDGEIVSSRGARFGAVANSVLYGSGVFTTLAIVRGRPVFWEQHSERLRSNAARIGVGLPRADLVFDSLLALIEANGIADGRARVTVVDASPSRLWSTGSEDRSQLVIAVARRRELPDAFRIASSPFPINSRSPLAGIKSCNYLENLIALDTARESGYDEALRLNERGEVASAACANVFWTRDGRIFTPALETGCLAGTTRAFVIGKFDVEEVSAGYESVRGADSIFLTSAGIGARRAVLDETTVLPDPAADEAVRSVLDVYGM